MKLSSKVRQSVNTGKIFNAVVREIFFDKVTVQVSGTGQLLRNLPIIGGPVSVGDAVTIDFSSSSSSPVVTAKGNSYASLSDVEGLLKRIGGDPAAKETFISVVLYSGGVSVAMYPASSTGIQDALDNSIVGDVVWLPDVDITVAELTIPEGVTLAGVSSRQSILRGKVVLGEGCTLENMKVVGTATGTDPVYCVKVNSVTSKAHILNCEIHGYHCGTGQSSAIEVSNSGLLDVEGTLIVADTGGTTAYAIKSGTGCSIRVTHSRFYAKTDWYNVTGSNVEEYSNVEAAFSEIDFWCAIPDDRNYPYSWSDGNAFASMSNFFGSKIAIPPSTPVTTEISSYTGPADKQAGNMARNGDFIYFAQFDYTTTIKIREWKISDGTYVDIPIPSNGAVSYDLKFVVVEDRKLLVYRDPTASTSYVHTIYLVDFEEVSCGTYYEFSSSDPVIPSGDYEYRLLASNAVAARTEDGDLHILFYGQSFFYDATVMNQRAGLWILSKNWTQDGPWTMVSVPGIPEEEDVWGETMYLYCPNWVAQGRYLVLVPSWRTTFALHADSSPVSKKYISMFVYDILLGTLTSTVNDYGGGAAVIEFYETIVDHESCVVYGSSYDEPITGSGTLRIYKFDPVNLAITVHYSTTDEFYITFAANKSRCFFVLWGITENIDFYDAKTLSLVLNDFPKPTKFVPDIVLDDNENRLWYYDVDDNLIHGFDIEDNVHTTFDPGVSEATLFPFKTFVWSLGDVFVIYRSKTDGPTISYWLIKE